MWEEEYYSVFFFNVSKNDICNVARLLMLTWLNVVPSKS